MHIMNKKGLKVELDDEGYLINSEDWDENVAHALAEKEEIKELTKERMDIINFLKDYYKKHNLFPVLKLVCRSIHQPDNCVLEQYNRDPLKAWKKAGLPKPTAEMFAHLNI